MSELTDEQVVESIRLYRETLAETKALYIDSGKAIHRSYVWAENGSGDAIEARSIAGQMDDLHQGLLMKVFAAAVPDATSRSLQQRQLGRVLLQHLWGKSVLGNQLLEAVDWLITASKDFQWQDLVRPFVEVAAIRDRWGELETLIMRMANLLVAIDGDTSVADNANLDAMGQTLKQLSGEPATEHNSQIDSDNARDAIEWLRAEAKRLRDGTAVNSENVNETPGNITPGNITKANETQTNETKSKQTAGVIDERTPEQRLAEAREKLDQLIGLDAIKDQIQTLTNFLKMESWRQKEGLPTTRPSLHMAFVGNPGTGKTTVARIIADIYGSLGILEKGHLVETDRSGLVAEYAGQTGPKTNAKIDEALDGVLFIDEAYTLIDKDGQDQYGREAVQTLLKRMEDQRDRLVVILAGYPVEMRKMIRSNPGLSSRVGTTMLFDDYSPEDLSRIFELMAKKSKYSLPTQSRRRLLRGFTYLYVNRDRHFGNGRTSRNSFERSVRRLANRLAVKTEVTRDDLTTLCCEDIEVAEITQDHLGKLAADKGLVRVKCSHCSHPLIIDDQLLGTTVKCEACQEKFAADWGDPVMELPNPENEKEPSNEQ